MEITETFFSEKRPSGVVPPGKTAPEMGSCGPVNDPGFFHSAVHTGKVPNVYYGRIKNMKYKCLILDHDDTAVNSTPVIHYPAFLKILEELRPGTRFSMETFLEQNFSPGLGPFYKEELGFTDAEMDREFEIWQEYVHSTIPPFFEGMAEVIRRQKAEGGLVCVVSHSFPECIRRDYRAASLPEPDLIFGWDPDRLKCKPNPYPLQEIMRVFGCRPEEMLMVDDLKPGWEMAKACHVPFAGCAWGYEVPEIRKFMEENADFYLSSVAELDDLLFSGANG